MTPQSKPYPKVPKPKERSRVTLIAGFVCPDGFVIAADTEVTGTVRTQETKVVGLGGGDSGYRLVIGGAGWGDYIDEAIEHISDEISALSVVNPMHVKTAIRREVYRIHDENIFKHWQPGDTNRPELGLIAGLRSGDEIAMWKTTDKSVSPVRTTAFLGTGAPIGQFVSQYLYRDFFPTAVVHHLATQIMREAKARGTNVGGNTDVWSVVKKGADPYFEVRQGSPAHDYLWGIHGAAMKCIRVALNAKAYKPVLLEHHITDFVDAVRSIRFAADNPFESQGDEWHTIEVDVPDTNPFSF